MKTILKYSLKNRKNFRNNYHIEKSEYRDDKTNFKIMRGFSENINIFLNNTIQLYDLSELLYCLSFFNLNLDTIYMYMQCRKRRALITARHSDN